MSSGPPPIQNGPQCPNCRAYLPHGQSYCANCGYGGAPPPSGGRVGLQVASIFLLILVGLPAGCMGACFFTMGASTMGSNLADKSGSIMTLVIGLGGFVLLGLLIWLVVAAFRRPR